MQVFIEIGDKTYEILEFLGEPIQMGDRYLYNLRLAEVV